MYDFNQYYTEGAFYFIFRIIRCSKASYDRECATPRIR